MRKSSIVRHTGGGGNEPQGGQDFWSKIPFFKFFPKTKFSVSDKNNFKNKVGWAFSPTLKYCWGRNPNLQKAISYASWNATCRLKGNFVPAFTLAEVLITLGIIGVVAAMTLPTLIANYNKQVVATKLKKFYTIMNQAVKLSEVKYGEFKYWDNTFTGNDADAMEAWWDKYFRPYIKTLKTDQNGRSLLVYLADGTKFAIFNHLVAGLDPSVSVSSIHLYFYPNAANRSNIHGKDYFTFYINSYTNKKWAVVEPYKFGWNGKRDMLLSGGSYSCNKNVADGDRHYCTALIQLNNWEIPDDYPFKF